MSMTNKIQSLEDRDMNSRSRLDSSILLEHTDTSFNMLKNSEATLSADMTYVTF